MSIADDNYRFRMIFWFIVGMCGFVGVYSTAISFLHVPKENQQFVNIILPFFLGTILGGCIGYLVGGNPQQQTKKVDPPPGTTTEVSANIETTTTTP